MSGSPLGAAFAALFLGMGVASLVAPRPEAKEPPDFELKGWIPSAERLGPVFELDASLVAKHPVDALANTAIDTLLDFGRTEVLTGGRMSEPSYSAATQRLVERMNRYWFERGEEGYRALGARMADRFVAAVEAVLSRAREANEDPRTWVAKNASHPVTRELHAVSGNFLSNAVSWGLITRDARVAGGSTALLRIHFKLRWYRLVNDITDYTFLLHVEELRALWRFRLEADRTRTMKQRLRTLQRLRDIDPDYPAYRTLGALYAQEGRYERAIPFYREALLMEPFDPLLRRNLAFLLDAVD